MTHDNTAHASHDDTPRITVVGVGGGGCNAVRSLIASGLPGVHCICANTDMRALERSPAACALQIGEQLLQGRGAGGDPAAGREAALESVAAVKRRLAGAAVVVVAAGMGGGTGSGAAPVIVQAAGELGALTLAVVTKPFGFEGAGRKAAAEAGIAGLARHAGCLLVIPNDRLLALADKRATPAELFGMADEILRNAVLETAAAYRRWLGCGRQPHNAMFGDILEEVKKSLSGILEETREAPACAWRLDI